MLKQILSDNKITDSTIANLVASLKHKQDYADVFFEYLDYENFILEDGIIKDASNAISHGVGLRSNYSDKTNFAYSDNLDLPSINQAANFVIGSDNRQNSKQGFNQQKINNLYTQKSPITSIDNEKKVFILNKINEIARKNPLITQVNASISSNYQEILVASSDGIIATDYRPLVRLNVSLIASKNGRIESASYGGGGRFDYSYFLDDNLYEQYTEEALRQVMLNLKAEAAPAGTMPVILGSGWPGVLLHEAIGHGLEGDFNRKKTSCFTDKIGKQIASNKCTIVDNGALNNRRGSLNVDDEGTPTQNNILVKDGILQGYMFDKLNARLMGVNSTGNGRRESYAHIPMPRMTNTYMLGGSDNFDDMISSVDDGIYAVNFAGGQVDITSGEFVFSASEAYLIKNGKITKPIKGATLIGKGEEVLKHISMVGSDEALDSGIGVCGKDGQSVPVGVGQPSLKVDNLVVGGTNT
jgi:TldD protein